MKLTTALLRFTPSKENTWTSSSRVMLLAVVFGRPAEQAQEIDESLRQKSGVAIGGDGNHRAVPPLRELAAIGRDQQRQMRELRRLDAAARKIRMCLKVFVRWSCPRTIWLMRRSTSSAQEAR